MQKQLERNLPGHLKKYSGAFMQQQVMDPSISGGFTPGAGPATSGAAPTSYHPTTHMPRGSDHKNDARAAGGRPVTGAPAEPEPLLPDHVSPEEAFDFIVNPEIAKPKKSLVPSSGSSLPVRIAFFGGGLVALIIIFVVAKSFIAGGSALPSYVTIVQDQQALLHIVTAADDQQDLTVTNKNFVATASLSLGTSQSDMINYLAKNSKKIKPSQINLRVSQTTDAQLASAAAAATYNETFKQVMRTKLSSYAQELQKAYLESSGEKGKALLSDEYTQAKLLLTQLDDTRS